MSSSVLGSQLMQKICLSKKSIFPLGTALYKWQEDLHIKVNVAMELREREGSAFYSMLSFLDWF